MSSRILTFDLDDALTYSSLMQEGIDENALVAAAAQVEKYRKELEEGVPLSRDWEELL